MKRTLFGSVALLSIVTAPALACEGYKDLSSTEMREYRDKLVEADADPLDQLFAFKELVCSKEPTMRDYAIRTGMEKVKDNLVRNQIMLDAMLGKERVDIDLKDGNRLTKKDKEFVRQYDGVVSKTIYFRSMEEGCLSVSSSIVCDTDAAFVVKGDKVLYKDSYAVGEFQLASDGTLVGYVRPGANGEFTRIPAVIRLF